MEKNHDGLFGGRRCGVPGMLGGRELGATIGGGLGREGTEAPLQYLGGRCAKTEEGQQRNKIAQTPTFTNLSLFAYTDLPQI